MMGTGPFAVPTFESLLDSRHHVVALVTRPAAPVKGKQQPPRPMYNLAAQLCGLPIHEPESVNSPEAQTALGMLLIGGRGVPKDEARGLRLVRAAATAGHANAQWLLGELLSNARGVALTPI